VGRNRGQSTRAVQTPVEHRFGVNQDQPPEHSQWLILAVVLVGSFMAVLVSAALLCSFARPPSLSSDRAEENA
jgi:hypothetical protein